MRAAPRERVRDRPPDPGGRAGDGDDSRGVVPTSGMATLTRRLAADASSARRPASRDASAMIVSAGLAEPCVGITLPSAMNRFGTPHTRWSASTTLSCGRATHPAAADEVGVAVDRQDVLRSGRLPDLMEGRLGVGDVRAIVVALRVVEAGDRDAALVGLLGERHAVFG